MKNQEIFEKIKKSIFFNQANEEDDSLSLVLDRYRRHDHGGGDDGDDWLDDYEINEDFNKGKKAHQSKLDTVNKILTQNGFYPNAEFELSEKGQFSIEINLKPK